jgi:3-methyladenine DNA glycosylase/8-oxoguanine DNA glycosylase
LGQQISVKGSFTMSGRLVQAFGEQLRRSAMSTWGLSFNAHSAVRRTFRKLMTGQRTRSIQGWHAVADGDSFSTSANLEGAIERLTALPGIGAWTAHYIAMRLREPDAFPAGDLGLRRAISADGKSAWSEKDLIECSQAWRPWRAYAAMHLWNRYGALRNK